MSQPNQLLHYHKCDDCLTAFSTVEPKVDYCDCNGTVTYMGVVHGDKYQKMGTKSACDKRCTDACGPMCDCVCGGVNHGTGKLVQCVIAEGKIKITGLNPEDVERADRFRALRDFAQQVYEKNKTYPAKRELIHALSLRVYDKRTKAIMDFINLYYKD